MPFYAFVALTVVSQFQFMPQSAEVQKLPSQTVDILTRATFLDRSVARIKIIIFNYIRFFSLDRQRQVSECAKIQDILGILGTHPRGLCLDVRRGVQRPLVLCRARFPRDQSNRAIYAFGRRMDHLLRFSYTARGSTSQCPFFFISTLFISKFLNQL